MNRIMVVSEIGSNHNGSLELAKKMIDVSKKCGADAVKFQTFQTDELVSSYAPMAKYQKDNLCVDESQKDMLKKLELSKNDFVEIFKYAKNKKILAFSTPFDIPSIEFLYSIGQTIWKIPSGEINNLPYLEKIALLDCKNKEIILSTGMANMSEIKSAINILDNGKAKITILHCNTNYPSLDKDLNLEAINKLHEEFPKYNIGLSDHSEGIVAPLIACGMSISMVEKHFTLNKNLPGPDHNMSIEPQTLEMLCSSIRRAEKMIGKKSKIVTSSEAKNIMWARKSIVAKRKIKKGEILSEENITTKRPANGISPMKWHEIIGTTAIRNFDLDELIEIKN